MPLIKKKLSRRAMNKAKQGKHNSINFFPEKGVFVKRKVSERADFSVFGPKRKVVTKLWGKDGTRISVSKEVDLENKEISKEKRYDGSGKINSKEKFTKKYFQKK